MAIFKDRPQLIAHRGYSERYPENTLSGLGAAIHLGVDCIEFDVQFSKDGVPIVIHDSSLKRTTGVEGSVYQSTYEKLTALEAAETCRFGDQFKGEPLPTLEAVLALLEQWPEITAFVEVKTEAVEYFGAKMIARCLVPMLEPYREQIVVISFDLELIEIMRNLGVKYIGWIIPQWDEPSKAYAQTLRPDVLFCDYKKIPEVNESLWQGPWRWALYDIVDPGIAAHWIEHGVMFIESWDIGKLMYDPILASYLERNTRKT